MDTTDQPSLLARLRILSHRIVDYRRRYALPKGNPDRYETHSAAYIFQNLKTERDAAQRELDPIKLIASGISCRDCLAFSDLDAPLCHRGSLLGTRPGVPTKAARANGAPCGPHALMFAPRAAHA